MKRRITTAIATVAAVAGSMFAAVPSVADEVVLVPTQIVYPGDVIDASTMREVTLKPGRQAPPAMATTLEQLDGMVAKRTLLPGRYVPVSALRQAYLVEQGAPVQVVLVAGPLTISVTAISLQPGAAGDVIRVRNVDSGRVVSGIVTADGTVRVGTS